MSRLIHRLTVMCAVFQLSIGLAIAQEPLTTLIPWRQFEGYPRSQQIGDQGHRILDSWFTGRWYCAVIGAGSKGKPANVPFAAPGLPITDESAIAIVAIDTKSDQARCTLLRPAVLKHLRIQSKDCFSIVAEDAKVERLRRECHDIDFSLPEMVAVHRKIPCDFEPRDGIVRARQDRPIAANGTEKMNWLTSEGNGFATIDVTEANPRTHLLSHGSVQDRIIVSQAIGKSLFSVSEQDASVTGRTYWLVSEAMFPPRHGESKARVAKVHVPRTLIGPVMRMALVVEYASESLSLFEVTNGQVKRCYDFPDGYTLARFEVSEEEKFAAIEMQSSRSGVSDLTVSVDLATGKVIPFADHTEQEPLLFTVGITNQGSLIQEGNCGVFVADPATQPRLLRELLSGCR